MFRAVSHGHASGEIASVAVPDQRLNVLSKLHSSAKTTPIHINFIDIHAAERTEASAVGRLRTVDAVLIVVPAFGGQEPKKELAASLENMILADMLPVSTRLQRARKDTSIRGEVEILEAALDHLENGRLLREREWNEVAIHALSPLALISLKPIIALWNLHESEIDAAPPATDSVVEVISACALLEAEASALEPEESKEILEGYGIAQPLKERLISAVYRNLDLVTFFVTDQKETRALAVPKGATAFDAAGHVHTDMQRGFIRAEVASFEKVAEAGSWEKAKASGAVKVEGKEHPIAEGDVIRFRFSV